MCCCFTVCVYFCLLRSLIENRIERIEDGCFSGNKKLTLLKLKDNPIKYVGKDTFTNLPDLGEL